MFDSKRHAALGATAAVLALASSVPARAASVHERGVISAVDGSVVKVKTRDGRDIMLDLAEGWNVAGVSKASVADITPGTFIGTATTGEDEGLKALEVVVFPEAMKGTGEGHYAWDLQPKSMMTNATVSHEVKATDGKTVTLSYKGGEKKVEIKDATPVVAVGSATRDDLVVGAKVFVAGPSEAADGKVEKGTVVVGKGGVTPPM